MGVNQSSAEKRSASMDNASPAGVIDVSDDVVQRLKQGIRKANAAKKKQEEDKPTGGDVPPKHVPSTRGAGPATRETYYVNPTPPSQPQAQISRFSNKPNIAAFEMHRQKEIELKQNDEMWRTRMGQLEQTLNETNTVMEKEYSAAFEDVRKRFIIALPAHQSASCQNVKAQLIACYRAYPGETLKCAEEVELFRNCVDVHRIKGLELDSHSVAAVAK